jgi:hypothetical protein
MMQSTSSEQAELARFHRDVAYYEAHHDELMARYPEKWIAIYDEAVVDAAPDIESLLDTLRQRGVPPEQALVKHLTRDEDIPIVLGSAYGRVLLLEPSEADQVVAVTTATTSSIHGRAPFQ